MRARRLVWDLGLGVGLWAWIFPVINFEDVDTGMPNVISPQNLLGLLFLRRMDDVTKNIHISN